MHIHTQVNMAMPDVSVDELERYVKDSVVPTENPVDWWIMNRKVYPNLSKLGITVHLVMGTSFILCELFLFLTAT